MRLVIIVIQLLISAFVTASVIPALLAALPAARDQRVGLSLVAALMAVSFAVISFVWPRRKT